MIPAAAYLILAEQTRRLCQPSGDAEQTRRVTQKLVLHFAGLSLPPSARRVAEANLALASTDHPETYALRCLSTVTRVVREEQQHREMIAKFDGLAESSAKLADALARLSGGAR